MTEFLICAGAYGVGSVPFGLLLSRSRGIDLRRVGSGNVGAANVLRTSGPNRAIATLCLDGVKGAIAVLAAQSLSPAVPLAVAAGVCAIVGHIYPVWLGFRGGKGVATAAGVFGILAPAAAVVSATAFVVAVWRTRFISVGSLVAAAALVLSTWLLSSTLAVPIGAAAAAAVIVHRHRSNIVRLASGTERPIGYRVSSAIAQPTPRH